MGIGIGFNIVPSPRAKLIGRSLVFGLAFLAAFVLPVTLAPWAKPLPVAYPALFAVFWAIVGTAYIRRPLWATMLLLRSGNVRTVRLNRLPLCMGIWQVIMFACYYLYAAWISGSVNLAAGLPVTIGFSWFVWLVVDELFSGGPAA